jgi:MFS family permease
MKGQRWIVDSLTFLLFGFFIFELIKTAVLMPTISKELRLNLYQTGLLLGIFSGGPGIIMGVIGGSVVDKIGSRYGGLFPLIGFTVVTIGIGLSSTYLEIASAIIIFGVFESFTNTVVYKLTGNWFGRHERGLGAGITNSASPFFAFLAPAVAIPLLLFFHNNFHDVFLLFALFSVPLVILWILFVYDRPEQSKFITMDELKIIYRDELNSGLVTESDLDSSMKQHIPLDRINDKIRGSGSVSFSEAFKYILSNKENLGLIIGIGVMNLIWGSYAVVLPSYFSDYLLYSTATLGLYTTITYLAGFLGAVVSGILTLKYNKLIIMKIGVIVSLIATVPLIFVNPGVSPSVLLPITAIGFFGILLYFPPFFSYTAEYFGKAVLGRVLGLQYSFIALALAFGPTIMFSIAAISSWKMSYLFDTVMVVVAIILTFTIKETKKMKDLKAKLEVE